MICFNTCSNPNTYAKDTWTPVLLLHAPLRLLVRGVPEKEYPECSTVLFVDLWLEGGKCTIDTIVPS
jgi:hypothetical protein